MRSWKTSFVTCAALIFFPFFCVAESLWSDPSTWNGILPQPGEDVTIPQGTSVVLDVTPPPLGDLVIKGSLKVKDIDLTLTADTVLIDGGVFEVGTQGAPFRSHFTLTLLGPKEDLQYSGHSIGGRFLAVGQGGILSFVGYTTTTQPTWTQLAVSAAPGSEQLELADAVTWKVGDRVVLAPSGFDPAETEVLSISAMSQDGKLVSISPPLAHYHSGSVEVIDGKVLDTRAEVGSLTRNITVQGPESSADPNSSDFQFGFHAIFLHGSKVHIEGARFLRGGQVGIAARYPIHWHHVHHASGHLVKNNVIEHSFQRAIVVHGTHHVRVEGNVAYNIKDSAMVFAEDGDERHNVFDRNLVVYLVRKVRGETCDDPQEFAFCVDNHSRSTQAESRPGAYWGRSIHNTLTRNHAAGIFQGNGFFFHLDFVEHSTRVDASKLTSALVFSDNTAHTIKESFYNPFYGPQSFGNGLHVGRFEDDGVGEYVFNSFTSYKVPGSCVWIEDEKHELRNAALADCGVGVFVKKSTIRDSLIVGESSNRVGGRAPLNKIVFEMGYGVRVDSGGYGSWPKLDGTTFYKIPRAAIGSRGRGLPFLHKEEGRSKKREYMLVERSKVLETPVIFDQQWSSLEDNSSANNISVFYDLDGSLVGNGVPAIYGDRPFSLEGMEATYFEATVNLPESKKASKVGHYWKLERGYTPPKEDSDSQNDNSANLDDPDFFQPETPPCSLGKKAEKRWRRQATRFNKISERFWNIAGRIQTKSERQRKLNKKYERLNNLRTKIYKKLENLAARCSPPTPLA